MRPFFIFGSSGALLTAELLADPADALEPVSGVIVDVIVDVIADDEAVSADDDDEDEELDDEDELDEEPAEDELEPHAVSRVARAAAEIAVTMRV